MVIIKVNILANTSQTYVLRGKASYAKVLGDPVLNYSKDGKEHKVDLVLTKEAVKDVKGYGIADKVRTKDNYLDGSPFLSFKQPELRRDGEPNKPIPVVDIAGNTWDPEKLIGNGSDIDVKFSVVDYGVGKKKGMYIRGIRVLKLVPYNATGFAPISEDDEFAANLAEVEAAEKAGGKTFSDDGIDDEDVPF